MRALNKLIVQSLISLFSMALGAQNIYVSTNGDDSFEGSLEDPFLTIQKAANMVKPGDTVWIRGGIYRESVSLSTDGLEGQPVVFCAYQGEEVVISGCDLLTGWTEQANGIWEAPMQSSMPEYRNQLFINGKAMTKARWPNSLDEDPLTPEGAACDQPKCSMTKIKVLGDFPATWTSSSLKGASIWVMAQSKWRAWNSAVSGYDPATGTISLNEVNHSWYVDYMNPGKPCPPSYGESYFILSGSRALLDAAGEWWFDNSNKKIQIIPFEGSVPGSPGVEIEAKKRNYGFVMNNRSYVEIKNIQFRATSISMNESKNCTLSGLYFYEFDFREGTTPLFYQSPGILISGQDNLVRECEFTRCSDAGVTLYGRNNAIVNCYFHEVDYAGYDGGPINLQGQGHLISHNTIEKTSRKAINPGGLSHLIQYNFIREVGLVNRDQAAIYGGGFDAGNTVICYNWIDVTNGNRESNASGIYMDNWHQNVIVHHNIVWNTSDGLIINRPGNYDVWVNNTTQGNIRTSYGPWIGMESMHGTYIHNNWASAEIDPSNFCWSKFNNRITSNTGMNISFDSGLPAPNSNPGGEDGGTFILGINDTYEGEGPDIGALENGKLNWSAGHNFNQQPNPLYEPAGFYYRNYITNGGFDYEQVSIYPKFNHYYKWTKTGLMNSLVEYHAGYNYPDAGKRNSIYANSLHLRGLSDDGVEQFISKLPSGHFIFSAYIRLVDSDVPASDVYLSVLNGENEVAGAWSSNVMLTGNQKWRMVKVPFWNLSEGDITVRITKQGNGEAYVDNIGLVPEYFDNPFEFAFDTSQLEIVVQNGLTKEILPGCRINFNNLDYITNEEGTVSIANVAPNQYSLLVEKEGYLDYSINAMQIYADKRIIINLTLKPFNVLVKIVDSATQDPVYRAIVNYKDKQKMTNSSGEASFENITRDYSSFIVEHNDYFEQIESFNLFNDTMIVISMTNKLAGVSFYISDASGPLENAAVTLGNFTLLTNMEGYTFFNRRQARSEYSYLIHIDGYKDVPGSLYLERDTTVYIQVDPLTGISDIQQMVPSIYPNPVQDKIYISFYKEKGNMHLLSMDGKIIASWNLGMGIQSFDLSSLSNGCYMLNLQSEKSTWKQLVIKTGYH
ncbi:T9SS type A sorting domain-containing protein [Bacteroidota bacterium]